MDKTLNDLLQLTTSVKIPLQSNAPSKDADAELRERFAKLRNAVPLAHTDADQAARFERLTGRTPVSHTSNKKANDDSVLNDLLLDSENMTADQLIEQMQEAVRLERKKSCEEEEDDTDSLSIASDDPDVQEAIARALDEAKLDQNDDA